MNPYGYPIVSVFDLMREHNLSDSQVVRLLWALQELANGRYPWLIMGLSGVPQSIHDI
jgi:hypothetical protein